MTLDCLALGTLAALVAMMAARRLSRFEREAFVSYFVMLNQAADQKDLLDGGRVELLALFSNPILLRSELRNTLPPLKLGQEIKSLLTAVPSVYSAIEPAASLVDVSNALAKHDPQVLPLSTATEHRPT